MLFEPGDCSGTIQVVTGLAVTVEVLAVQGSQAPVCFPAVCRSVVVGEPVLGHYWAHVLLSPVLAA